MNENQIELSPRSKRNLRARERYAANREKILERQREYYQTRREVILEKQAEYRKANRESILQKQSKYRQTEKGKQCELRKSEKAKQIRADKSKSRKTLKSRIKMKDRILKTPDHEMGKGMLHVLKTGVYDCSIYGKLSAEELDFVKSFILPPLSPPPRKLEKHEYHLKNKDKRLAAEKFRRDQKLEKEELEKLNFRFRKADQIALFLFLKLWILPLSPKIFVRENNLNLKVIKL